MSLNIQTSEGRKIVAGNVGGDIGIEVTQAEYDKLKLQNKLLPDTNYYITDAEFSNEKNEESDIYSTEEIKTNKIWIDGKPIYKKVVTDLDVTVNTNTNWNNIHAEPTVDTLVDIKVYTNNGIWYGAMLYQITNGYLQGYSTGLNTNIKGYVLEYTKK